MTSTRPQLHFTARRGWVNDPLALTWHQGSYHLFFQYLPDRDDWAPSCQWGHAVSDDLLTWTEQPVAIAPGDGDDGCWSGSVVSPPDGSPRMFYTAISLPAVGNGRVRVARPTDSSWREWGKGDVVLHRPPDLDGALFRDPFVFADGPGWRMIVGAGLPDGTATAAVYSSPDLVAWTHEGRLAQRHTTERAGAWTGALWECPQLFPVDDRHVLVVSVWDDDELHSVAYAVGHHTQGRFEAEAWHRLTYGDSLYAASTYVDRHGQRGLIAWLRGVSDHAGGWTGALSLPLTVHWDDGRLRVAPHANLLTLRRPPPPQAGAATFDAEWRPDTATDTDAGHALELRTDTGACAVRIVTNTEEVRIEVTDAPRLSMPTDGPMLRVVRDAGVLEVLTDTAVLAVGLPEADEPLRPVASALPTLTWWSLA